ncbi:hypothetical protein F5Y08DRAFT_332494 [Xylaria arbuscula]|nr:hypothetical protein F5Y08DRAFT_332494 [Xylaria arbuscula]
MPFGLATESGCPVCYPKIHPHTQLLLYSGCKVVRYCGPEHQREHRSKHKAACTSIISSRQQLEREEAKLRAHPGDIFTPSNPFENSVGHFWGILDTLDTMSAVEKALAHFQDMLRLCRGDNLGIRDLVPSLLLRLGREQDCYDFIKWWAAVDDDYDWGDMSLPYLDIRNADAFEEVEIFVYASHLSLSQFVILALLKVRLHGDIESYNPEYSDSWFSWPPPPTEIMRPIGELAKRKVRTISVSDVSDISESLKSQYQALFRMIHNKNPHVWEALVDASEDTLSLPSAYSVGSVEEAILSVYQCKKAWEESYDAIIMIESELGELTEVYEGPTAGSYGVNTAEAVETSERRKGSGRDQLYHLVNRTDSKMALAYADGACSDNGQQNPRAAWAAVLRPAVGDNIPPFVVSGRLELKGPFGDESLATSNRAELRAAIAILRENDWQGHGFNCIVIATDSSYLVDGATEWARSWVRNGWKTRNGGTVKNRDLWELFLGEIEKCKETGLEVKLWKIPRELNMVADAMAKATIQKGPAPAEFEDKGLVSSAASISASSEPRITAKATMDRATTQNTALEMLSQNPPPSAIFITDGGVVRLMKVWERVIDCVRRGSTVVLAAGFSSFVNEGQFNRCFGKAGLPWKRGGYYRTDVNLRPWNVNNRLKSQLLPDYSQKALYIKGAARSDVWYAGESDEVAVAFAKVGNGMLGYVGDVNGEDGSELVVLAMLGLLG